MSTFVIDAENSITALDGPEQAQGGEVFHSEQELAELATQWPAARLVEVWNGIPGLAPVKKFRDRGTAISRIWSAIQSLNDANQEAQPVSETRVDEKKTGKPKASRKKVAKPPAARRAKQLAAREGSKKERVLALLQSKGGATLNEIMKATGWQAHSVRGFISGTLSKEMGLKVESTKSDDGERTYHIAR